MRPCKVVFVAMLLAVVLVWTGGCTVAGKTGKPVVAAGGRVIECVEAENAERNQVTQNGFTFAFRSGADYKVEYVPVGETVTLDFGSRGPSSVVVSDILLDPSGVPMYSDKEVVDTPLASKDATYSFLLERHPASDLSSRYSEDAKAYRGFAITAHWGEEAHDYFFVIMTDG